MSDPSVFGVDVSHWEGPVDWDTALAVTAPNKIGFVFAKATELFMSNGAPVRQHDKQFDRNWSELARLNTPRGAFHYCMPEFTPNEMAELFFSVYQPSVGDLVPAMDIEDEYLDAMTSGTKTRAQLVGQLLDFGALIEAEIRKKPFIYTRADITDALGNPPEFAAFPLWIAAYRGTRPIIPVPWSDYTIWQYTDKGNWTGFPSAFTTTPPNIDFDTFNGSLADLDLLRIRAGE